MGHCQAHGLAHTFSRIFYFVKTTSLTQKPSLCTALSQGVLALRHLFCPTVWACFQADFGSSHSPLLSAWELLRPLGEPLMHPGLPGPRANSLHSAKSLHLGPNWSNFLICEFRGALGRKSRRFLPSSSWAGESPVSWSGVLRSCKSPLTSLAVSISPDGLTASLSSLFAAPTDFSAF